MEVIQSTYVVIIKFHNTEYDYYDIIATTYKSPLYTRQEAMNKAYELFKRVYDDRNLYQFVSMQTTLLSI